MRSVTVLGSTGSVGQSTVDLLKRNPQAFDVRVLTANRNVELLAEQARDLKVETAVVADEARYGDLKSALAGSGIEVAAGRQALLAAAAIPVDWTMAAIVGARGLEPTLAAIDNGGIIAVANKECLVCAGELITSRLGRTGATLLPVDSEHNAIFQVFQRDQSVRRIVLTASGGPFRAADRSVMAAATPAQAVAHPVWSMGAKISVDSATMMNKGLEIIEASYLFGLSEDAIDVLVHPQSVIHSMVEYADGSVLAQLGTPDMRIPIAYTLAWPKRMTTPAATLDLAAIASLTFEAPDTVRFPCLDLARSALRTGGTAPAILNAANEVAVEAFLLGRIGFLDIAAVNDNVHSALGAPSATDLAEILAIDAEARRHAEATIAGRSWQVRDTDHRWANSPVEG
ncbi:MAG: 1-deoxy-D-xylulose-5-phosphate reductoisomerase [Pseudomonadota bacterium]